MKPLILFLAFVTVGAINEPALSHSGAPDHQHDDADCPASSGQPELKCTEAMEICIERKRLQLEESGAVGILFQPDRDSSSRIRGVALLKIVQGSAADRGGLRAGDVVVEWNGHRVADDSFSSFGEHHSSMKKGQRTRYLVRRSDSTLEIDLVAGPRSKDNIAVSLGKYVFDNYGCSAYKAFWDEHNLQEKLEVNRIRPSPGGR